MEPPAGAGVSEPAQPQASQNGLPQPPTAQPLPVHTESRPDPPPAAAASHSRPPSPRSPAAAALLPGASSAAAASAASPVAAQPAMPAPSEAGGGAATETDVAAHAFVETPEQVAAHEGFSASYRFYRMIERVKVHTRMRELRQGLARSPALKAIHLALLAHNLGQELWFEANEESRDSPEAREKIKLCQQAFIMDLYYAQIAHGSGTELLSARFDEGERAQAQVTPPSSAKAKGKSKGKGKGKGKVRRLSSQQERLQDALEVPLRRLGECCQFLRQFAHCFRYFLWWLRIALRRARASTSQTAQRGLRQCYTCLTLGALEWWENFGQARLAPSVQAQMHQWGDRPAKEMLLGEARYYSERCLTNVQQWCKIKTQEEEDASAGSDAAAAASVAAASGDASMRDRGGAAPAISSFSDLPVLTNLQYISLTNAQVNLCNALSAQTSVLRGEAERRSREAAVRSLLQQMEAAATGELPAADPEEQEEDDPVEEATDAVAHASLSRPSTPPLQRDELPEADDDTPAASPSDPAAPFLSALSGTATRLVTREDEIDPAVLPVFRRARGHAESAVAAAIAAHKPDLHSRAEHVLSTLHESVGWMSQAVVHMRNSIAALMPSSTPGRGRAGAAAAGVKWTAGLLSSVSDGFQAQVTQLAKSFRYAEAESCASEALELVERTAERLRLSEEFASDMAIFRRWEADLQLARRIHAKIRGKIEPNLRAQMRFRDAASVQAAAAWLQQKARKLEVLSLLLPSNARFYLQAAMQAHAQAAKLFQRQRRRVQNQTVATTEGVPGAATSPPPQPPPQQDEGPVPMDLASDAGVKVEPAASVSGGSVAPAAVVPADSELWRSSVEGEAHAYGLLGQTCGRLSRHLLTAHPDVAAGMAAERRIIAAHFERQRSLYALTRNPHMEAVALSRQADTLDQLQAGGMDTLQIRQEALRLASMPAPAPAAAAPAVADTSPAVPSGRDSVIDLESSVGDLGDGVSRADAPSVSDGPATPSRASSAPVVPRFVGEPLVLRTTLLQRMIEQTAQLEFLNSARSVGATDTTATAEAPAKQKGKGRGKGKTGLESDGAEEDAEMEGEAEEEEYAAEAEADPAPTASEVTTPAPFPATTAPLPLSLSHLSTLRASLSAAQQSLHAQLSLKREQLASTSEPALRAQALATARLAEAEARVYQALDGRDRPDSDEEAYEREEREEEEDEIVEEEEESQDDEEEEDAAAAEARRQKAAKPKRQRKRRIVREDDSADDLPLDQVAAAGAAAQKRDKKKAQAKQKEARTMEAKQQRAATSGATPTLPPLQGDSESGSDSDSSTSSGSSSSGSDSDSSSGSSSSGSSSSTASSSSSRAVISKGVRAIERAHAVKQAEARRLQRQDEAEDPPFHASTQLASSAVAAPQSTSKLAPKRPRTQRDVADADDAKFVAPEGPAPRSPSFRDAPELLRFGERLAAPPLPVVSGSDLALALERRLAAKAAARTNASPDGDDLFPVGASSSEESAPPEAADVSSDEEEEERYKQLPALLDVEDAEREERRKRKEKEKRQKQREAKRVAREAAAAAAAAARSDEEHAEGQYAMRVPQERTSRRAREKPVSAAFQAAAKLALQKRERAAAAAAAAAQSRGRLPPSASASARMSAADARDAAREAAIMDDDSSVYESDDGMDALADSAAAAPFSSVAASAWAGLLPASLRTVHFAPHSSSSKKKQYPAAVTAAFKQRFIHPEAWQAQRKILRWNKKQQQKEEARIAAQARLPPSSARIGRQPLPPPPLLGGPSVQPRAPAVPPAAVPSPSPLVRPPPSPANAALRSHAHTGAIDDRIGLDLSEESAGMEDAAVSLSRPMVQSSLSFGLGAGSTVSAKPTHVRLPPMAVHVLRVRLEHERLPALAPQQLTFLLAPLPLTVPGSAAEVARELSLDPGAVELLPKGATVAELQAVLQRRVWDRCAARCLVLGLSGWADTALLEEQRPISDACQISATWSSTQLKQHGLHSEGAHVNMHTRTHKLRTSVLKLAPTDPKGAASQLVHVHTTELLACRFAFEQVPMADTYVQLCRAMLQREAHPGIRKLIQPTLQRPPVDDAKEEEDLPMLVDAGASDTAPTRLLLSRPSFHHIEAHLVPLLLALRCDAGQLRQLELSTPAMGDTAADALRQVLSPRARMLPQLPPPLSALRRLCLSHARLSELAWRSLLPSLGGVAMPTLQHVDLSNTAVGDGCIEQLGGMLSSCTQLQSLRLNDCTRLTGATDPWQTALSLSACTSLHLLSLSRCPLTPLTLEYLLRRLEDCFPRLASLSLDEIPALMDPRTHTRWEVQGRAPAKRAIDDALEEEEREEDEEWELVGDERKVDDEAAPGWQERPLSDIEVALAEDAQRCVHQCVLELATTPDADPSMDAARTPLTLSLRGWHNRQHEADDNLASFLSQALLQTEADPADGGVGKVCAQQRSRIVAVHLQEVRIPPRQQTELMSVAASLSALRRTPVRVHLDLPFLATQWFG